MHLPELPIDLPAIAQFAITALALAVAFVYLVKAASSSYLAAINDDKFEGSVPVSGGCERSPMVGWCPAADKDVGACVVCGTDGSKKCSGCKAVRYCSTTCQAKHWRLDHKYKCQELKLLNNVHRKRVPVSGDTFGPSLSLVPSGGIFKERTSPVKILFSYEEFIKLFNWDSQGFPPCGLINCGNSCFANVVLQCLSCTRPLVAYLLESGHVRGCRRIDWCLLCELQLHIQLVRQSIYPFSPLSILSRLPNIGGNLGCGSQEDAHEFMRFAIDTMQSVCLDEFGGEKMIDSCAQETTLISHIFGGQLESQVVCSKCDKVSHCHENMMDLTVEIQGDVSCLEECLNQFTIKEQLDGDNMYKCDGCNDYVKAWKRLTVNRAPNILTIALKRFQGGRFGKLNKRVTFPEELDLTPYMSDVGEDGNIYNLYAVVVHIDMLNASFFGHYICYTKDFSGNWYRVDDCQVSKVDLEEVLGQAAYMLLYSRDHVRTHMVERSTLKQSKEENLVLESSSKEVCINDSSHLEPMLTSENFVMASGCEVSDMADQSAQVSQKNVLFSENIMADSFDVPQRRGTNILCATAMNSLTSFKTNEDELGHLLHVSKDAVPIQYTSVSLSSCEESATAGFIFNKKINEALSGNADFPEDGQTDIHDTGSLSSDNPSASNSTRDKDPTSTSHIPYEGENLSPETTLELEVSSLSQMESPIGLSRVKTGANIEERSSGSRRDCKPLFSPGFLGKPVKMKSLIDKEKTEAVPLDIDGRHQSKEFVRNHIFGHRSQFLSDSFEITEGNCGSILWNQFLGKISSADNRTDSSEKNRQVNSKKSLLHPGFLNY